MESGKKLHHTYSIDPMLQFGEYVTQYMFASQFVCEKLVLDVGCGTGYGSNLLAKKGALKVIGMETSEECTEYFNDKHNIKNLQFQIGDFTKTNFGKSSFDIIISCNNILSRFDPDLFLLKSKQILKNDGMAIITVKRNSNIKEKSNDEANFRDLLEKYFTNVLIYHQFYPSTLAISKKGNSQDILEFNIDKENVGDNDVDVTSFIALCSNTKVQDCDGKLYLLDGKTRLLKEYSRLKRWKNILQYDLDAIKKTKLDPLFILFSIFDQRPDLKISYPEVVNGNYNRLIQWVLDICTNKITFEDDVRNRLSKFSEWYKEYLISHQIHDEVKDRLGEIQDLQSHVKELQSQKDAYVNQIEELQIRNERNEQSIVELQSQKDAYVNQIEELQIRNENSLDELISIKSSLGYKITRAYGSGIDRIFVDGTRRGELKKIFSISIRLMIENGMIDFARQAIIKIKRKEFKISEPLGQIIQKSNDTAQNDPSNLPGYSEEQCEIWMNRNQPKNEDLIYMRNRAKKFYYRPLISICIPVYNPKGEFLIKALQSVINQIYGNWELIAVDDGSDQKHVEQTLQLFSKKDERIKVWFTKQNQGIPKTLNHAFSKAKGDFVIILDNDDILEPHALFELVRHLNEHGDNFNLIYSDEALVNENDKVTYLHFRPDFSLDLFLSCQYFVHMVAIKKSVLNEVGGCDETLSNVAWDYDLWSRIVTRQLNKIGHIPRILYRWRRYEESTSTKSKDMVMSQSKIILGRTLKRLGIKGQVEDGYGFNNFRVIRELKDEKLSIIILSRDGHLASKCVQSIEKKTKFKNYEIIILANNLQTSGNRKMFEKIGQKHRVIFYDKPFNFSAMNNYAAKLANGKHFLFLNDDTEIIHEGSIEAMLEHSQRDDIGVVGAKLLFPGNTIQHVGVVMGLFDSCEHVHKFQENLPNYGGFSSLIRNYSAVTGAAMMIPKKVFEEVNGFDEELAIVFNDIDLCLRIGKTGRLVVYTPYAVFYHYEHASRKDGIMDLHPSHEDMIFRKKWEEIINYDPLYNPNLSRYHYDCRPNFSTITKYQDEKLNKNDIQTR